MNHVHAGSVNATQHSESGATMPSFELVTALQKQSYQDFSARLQPFKLPEYLNHDATLVQYWGRLEECFPHFQYLLVDSESGEALARGRSIPLRFEGAWSDLPDGGLDWVLERGFRDLEAGREPNLLSALFIVVSRTQLGRGLSYRMLEAMRGIARANGVEHLIAPVRPTLKAEYPLIPMVDYATWTRSDGLPFDPWIRVHVRSGGTIVRPCEEAMVVKAPVARWREWTGRELPGSGSYIVPGGLAPLRVDLDADCGAYFEPGLWILHQAGAERK